MVDSAGADPRVRPTQPVGANPRVRPTQRVGADPRVCPVKIKICGLTNLADALAAVQAGADALGFIFVPNTPRCVSPETVRGIVAQLPPFVAKVGVFVNEDLERVQEIIARCGLDLAQLHGDESPDYCAALFPRAIKSVRVKDAASLAGLDRFQAVAYLLDTYVPSVPGGTGQTFDWSLARQTATHGPIILSGGLTPDNVAEAICIAQPYAVDVGSGVEASPGKKDHAKMRAFVQAAKLVKAWGGVP